MILVINQYQNKMKYNRSLIMKRAWKLFNNQSVRTDEMFGDCLKESWQIAKIPLNFNDIYKKQFPLVMHQLSQNIKDSEVCKEIANDVFLQVNKHLATFDISIRKIESWIFGIAKNKIIDYYRAESDRAKVTMKISDMVNSEGQEAFSFVSDSDTSAKVENEGLSLKIACAMSKLKPQHKRIAELFYVEQLKYDEIAKKLDIPLGTVKGTLLRAKLMLQESLKEEYAML